MKINRTTLVLLVLVGAVAVGLAVSPSVRVRYHLWRLEALQEGGNSDTLFLQKRHCEALVDLDYFFHDSYELPRIRDVDASHQVYWQLMVNQKMTPAGYSLLSTDLGPVALEVYDLATRKSAWEAFVASLKSPGFEQKHAKLLDKVQVSLASDSSDIPPAPKTLTQEAER